MHGSPVPWQICATRLRIGLLPCRAMVTPSRGGERARSAAELRADRSRVSVHTHELPFAVQPSPFVGWASATCCRPQNPCPTRADGSRPRSTGSSRRFGLPERRRPGDGSKLREYAEIPLDPARVACHMQPTMNEQFSPDTAAVAPAVSATPASPLAREVERRRTFAIISHPDAGKTTLTEKLLLFGGAIQMAGTVKGRKAARHATSDWMALEKQRGISITSSVMQFPFRDQIINLLDTPGHEDFSEDTYRTLTAVDSALMVIDCAKGVEDRTIKLMEVCRMRDTPIMTFINKLDREGRPPIELLDEIESVLKIRTAPVTWPIGMGRDLAGIYHLLEDRIYAYEAAGRGERGTNRVIEGLHSAEGREFLGDRAKHFDDEIELVRGGTAEFDVGEYLAGRQTPVFFGSAISNFGVEELLAHFSVNAPGPMPRATKERAVEAGEGKLTGFVFKIQANMDPQHRDRIAFMRVCSGKYAKGMRLFHVRSGKEVRINDALTFLAADRQHTDEAFAGDIIGI